AGLLVEWDTGKRDAAIADAAKDDARREGLTLAGRDGAERAGRVGLEPVPHELDRLDPPLARDLYRRPEKLEHEPLRLAFRLTRRVLAQDGEIPLGVRIVRLGAL